MSDEKSRLRLSVKPEVKEMVEEIRQTHQFANNGDTISFIVTEYERLKKEQWSLSYITEAVAGILMEKLTDRLEENLRQINYKVDKSYFNSLVAIEMLNKQFQKDLSPAPIGHLETKQLKDAIAYVERKYTVLLTEDEAIEEAWIEEQKVINEKVQRRFEWEKKMEKMLRDERGE